jgi:hypothetical protein
LVLLYETFIFSVSHIVEQAFIKND